VFHMIHTYGVHDDDHSCSHHQEHFDHFGMDEDLSFVYNSIRRDLSSSLTYQDHADSSHMLSNDKNEEEGKLSRSPSTVMLFNDEPLY
jgi:hypothetical protein